MQSFVVLFYILSSGFLHIAFGALDPDGVPFPDDPVVSKHLADQALLKNYEHKQRNGNYCSFT